MASQTLQWRVDRVKGLIRKLSPNLAVSEQIIRLAVHLSRNDVYKRYLPQAEHLFRKSVSIADGAALPTDYVKYAENATYTLSGSTYVFDYIPVEKIAAVKKQSMFKAYADQPKLAIYNQQVHTYPSGITIDNFEYYWYPVDLFAADNSIPTTTTDNMPQETEFATIRGATERAMRMLMGHDAMVQFLEKNRVQVEQATMEFYRDTFGAEMKDLQVFNT